jgi:hypothetical protein
VGVKACINDLFEVAVKACVSTFLFIQLNTNNIHDLRILF